MGRHEEFLALAGKTDIYLIDQIMKGRFQPGMRILDAGCGSGRNLRYFLETGFEVYGVDSSEEKIDQLRKEAYTIRPHASSDNFRVAKVEKLGYDDDLFNIVLSIAVLHFASDEDHFMSMLKEMWRVLKPGGMFFCRTASTISIEKYVTPLKGRHYLLPDGARRFLVDETYLLRATHMLGAHFLEPIKTVNVQNQRAMTTWVLKK